MMIGQGHAATTSTTETEARIQAALRKRRRGTGIDIDAALLVPSHQPHPAPPNRVFRGG